MALVNIWSSLRKKYTVYNNPHDLQYTISTVGSNVADISCGTHLTNCVTSGWSHIIPVGGVVSSLWVGSCPWQCLCALAPCGIICNPSSLSQSHPGSDLEAGAWPFSQSLSILHIATKPSPLPGGAAISCSPGRKPAETSGFTCTHKSARLVSSHDDTTNVWQFLKQVEVGNLQ